MALILEITIFWRTDKDTEAQDITIIPQSQDPATIKQQIGRELGRIRDSELTIPGESYWYTVLKAKKLDGGVGYRTSPKTFF